MTKKLKGRLRGAAPEATSVFNDIRLLTQRHQQFKIEHTITTDNYGGAPWVPYGHGWHFVRSLNGWRTLWRRITLGEMNV